MASASINLITHVRMLEVKCMGFVHSRMKVNTSIHSLDCNVSTRKRTSLALSFTLPGNTYSLMLPPNNSIIRLPRSYSCV